MCSRLVFLPHLSLLFPDLPESETSSIAVLFWCSAARMSAWVKCPNLSEDLAFQWEFLKYWHWGIQGWWPKEKIKKFLSYGHNEKKKSAGFLVRYSVHCQEISLQHLPTSQTGDELAGTFQWHFWNIKSPFLCGEGLFQMSSKNCWGTLCLASVLCSRMDENQMLQTRPRTYLRIFPPFLPLTSAPAAPASVCKAIKKTEEHRVSVW